MDCAIIDNRDSFEEISKLLLHYDLVKHTTHCKTYSEGLSKIQDDVRVVIFDPDYNSESLFEFLQLLPSNIKKVASSNLMSVDLALVLMRYGVSDFVEKPIAVNKLAKAITNNSPVQFKNYKREDEIPSYFNLQYQDAKMEFDREYLNFYLQRENGSMSRVADAIGLDRSNLYLKLKALGMR